MNNEELIKTFYTAFSHGDAQKMTACYHSDIVFTDPAFGTLQKERAVAMWHMLLSQKNQSPTIRFSNIEATHDTGSAYWEADYHYGAKQRQVNNKIFARFKFQDDKIIEHVDNFNLWRWSQQALGPLGYILGWSPFMKNKILKTTNKALDKFMAKN